MLKKIPVRIFSMYIALSGSIESVNSVCNFAGETTLESNDSVVVIFREFCKPDCGKEILKVYEECGGDDATPEDQNLLLDQCQVNKNGEFCYETFLSLVEFVALTELQCFEDTLIADSCSCRSELSSAIQKYGCCLGNYHDYIVNKQKQENPSDIIYEPRELYTEYCGIELPKQCSGSLGLVSTITTVITTLLLTAIFL
jgi:hypothetical protein